MKSCLIGLAILTLPSVAAAQPMAGDYASPYDRQAWADTSRPEPNDTQAEVMAEQSQRALRYQDRRADGPAQQPGYYRDFWPAPQYGYTYGSARGRGYGYSHEDDRPYEPARPQEPYYGR